MISSLLFGLVLSLRDGLLFGLVVALSCGVVGAPRLSSLRAFACALRHVLLFLARGVARLSCVLPLSCRCLFVCLFVCLLVLCFCLGPWRRSMLMANVRTQ